MIYYLVMNASNMVIGRLEDEKQAITLARSNGGYVVPIKTRIRQSIERF